MRTCWDKEGGKLGIKGGGGDDVQLTASQVDQERPVEMFVIHQGRVDAGTGGVIQDKVADDGIPPKIMHVLLVDHHFLKIRKKKA